MTDSLKEIMRKYAKDRRYAMSIDPGIYNYMYVKSRMFKIKKFFHLLNSDDKTKEEMVEKWDEYGRQKLKDILEND